MTDWQQVRKEVDGRRRKTFGLAGEHASIMPTSRPSNGSSQPLPQATVYEQSAYHQPGTESQSAHQHSVEYRLSNALGARSVPTPLAQYTPQRPHDVHRPPPTIHQPSPVSFEQNRERNGSSNRAAGYPTSISEEQQPTFSVAPSRPDTNHASDLVSATRASPSPFDDTSALQPKSKRPRYNQWGGPWPAKEVPGQQTLVPDRPIQTQQSLPAGSITDRQRAASTIGEAGSPDEEVETSIQPTPRPFTGVGPAPDRPDNPNNTNRKFFDFPPVIGSYLHYSNKKLKYNPFPADLDAVREKLFHVQEPMLLNSQQIADYWPHVSNFWQRSTRPTVEENGTQVEVWECRNRRRIQRTEVPSYGKGVRKKEKKNKILEDILQCKPRIRLCSFTKHADTDEEHTWSGNEKSWRQMCKCIPEWLYIERTADTLRNDKEHTHDSANLDRFKRSDAMMYFCKLKVEEGGYSYSAVAKWVKEKYGQITKQCETLDKQDIANISQHWRRANRDVELKVVVEDEPLDVQMMKKTLDAIEGATETGVRKALTAVLNRVPEAYVHALPILEAQKAETSRHTTENGIKEGPTKELVKIVPEPGLPERIYIEPPDYLKPTPERETAALVAAESQVFRPDKHTERAAQEMRNVVSSSSAQSSQKSKSQQQHHDAHLPPFTPASSGPLSQVGEPVLAPRPRMPHQPQPHWQQAPHMPHHATPAGPPPPQLFQAPTPVQQPPPYPSSYVQPAPPPGQQTLQRPYQPQSSVHQHQPMQAYNHSPHGLPSWANSTSDARPLVSSSEPRPSWLAPINPRKRRSTEHDERNETSAGVKQIYKEVDHTLSGAEGPTITAADSLHESVPRSEALANPGASKTAASPGSFRASEPGPERVDSASTGSLKWPTDTAAPDAQLQPHAASKQPESSGAERKSPLSVQKSPESHQAVAATEEQTCNSAIELRSAEAIPVPQGRLGGGQEPPQLISSPRLRVFKAAFERWTHNPGKLRPEAGIKIHHFINRINKRLFVDDAEFEGAEATAAIKALYEEKKIEEADGLVYFWP